MTREEFYDRGISSLEHAEYLHETGEIPLENVQTHALLAIGNLLAALYKPSRPVRVPPIAGPEFRQDR